MQRQKNCDIKCHNSTMPSTDMYLVLSSIRTFDVKIEIQPKIESRLKVRFWLPKLLILLKSKNFRPDRC